MLSNTTTTQNMPPSERLKFLETGLLPVSRTPSLGVMMKPEVVHGDKADIQ